MQIRIVCFETFEMLPIAESDISAKCFLNSYVSAKVLVC